MKTIILAISGGVDSVVMLHSLVLTDDFAQLNFSKLNYIIAHFDHEIRKDSVADERFVAQLAHNYGIEYVSAHGNLGAETSENTARKARWEFLRNTKQKYAADFIATAHHADDVFETQIINLLRGTSRRGISVLKDTSGIIRPLRTRTKQDIYDYAVANKLEFVEDSTNLDMSYLRNWVRLSLVSKLPQQLKQRLNKVDLLNQDIDILLTKVANNIISYDGSKLVMERSDLRRLPEAVLRDIIRHAIDMLGIAHAKQKISFAMIERIAKFALRPDSNRHLHISKNLQAYISKKELILEKL